MIRYLILTLLFMTNLNYGFGQQNVPSVSKDLKILSWNIYMLPYLSLFNGNASRAEVITDQLKKSDYQIVVFQEAFSSRIRRILKKQLADNFPFQYGPMNKNYTPFRTNSGLMIISKIPLQIIDQIEFGNLKGFDAVARKGAVLLEGEYSGSKFQLITTHLQADDNENNIRATQCIEIKRKLLDPYFDHNKPQLICGDFNVDMSDTANYHFMLHTLEADNGNMVGDVHVTYDEVNNNLARNKNNKLKVLDYVLTRNTHLINKIDRRVEKFLTTVKGKKTNLSDHYALEFVVNIKNTSVNENTLWAFTH